MLEIGDTVFLQARQTKAKYKGTYAGSKWKRILLVEPIYECRESHWTHSKIRRWRKTKYKRGEFRRQSYSIIKIIKNEKNT